MRINHTGRCRRERGVVLLISVIMLLILAGLSITVLTSSVTEKVIAHDSQDSTLAQESANEAVYTAKKAILDTWTIGNNECQATPCTCGSGLPCVWVASTFSGIDFTQQSATWWNTFASTANSSNPNTAENPQYIIIDLGCDAVLGANQYRIVGRGVGGTTDTVAFSDEIMFVNTSNFNTIVSATSSSVTAFVDSAAVSTFQLSPATVSSGFFENTTGTNCPSGTSSYAECDMNCAGAVRVMAWTVDDGCIPTYGPWAALSTDLSSVTLYLSGVSHTLSCQVTSTGCTTSAECPGGETCVNGTCQSSGCTTSAECPGGQTCVNGTCQSSGCVTDSQCPEGEVCVSGSCQSSGCVTDSQCPGGEVCVSGSCQSSGCVTDSQCPGGEVCVSGSCQSSGCVTDSQCPGGESCVNGICQ